MVFAEKFPEIPPEYFKVLLIIALVLVVIAFIINVVMLLGAVNRKPEYLKPWLIVAALSLVLSAGQCLYTLFTMPFLAFVMNLFSLGINLLVSFCVLSYYKQLTQAREVSDKRLGEF